MFPYSVVLPSRNLLFITSFQLLLIFQLLDEMGTLFCKTLLEFSVVFEYSPGHTNVVTHIINIGDATPIRQYPRRLPYAYRGKTRNQVNEMLEQGVIKSISSPWASSSVLVKKKDGKYHFCVDYRKFNQVTK